jgi:hypothetical protein
LKRERATKRENEEGKMMKKRRGFPDILGQKVLKSSNLIK